MTNKVLRRAIEEKNIDTVRFELSTACQPLFKSLDHNDSFMAALEDTETCMAELFTERLIQEIKEADKVDLSNMLLISSTLDKGRFYLTARIFDEIKDVDDLSYIFQFVRPKLEKLRSANQSQGVTDALKGLTALHSIQAERLRRSAASMNTDSDPQPSAERAHKWLPRSLAKAFLKAKNKKLASAIENQDLEAIETAVEHGATPITFNALVFTPSLLERVLHDSPPAIQQKLATLAAQKGDISTGYFTAMDTAAELGNIPVLKTLLAGIVQHDGEGSSFTHLNGDIQRLLKQGKSEAAALTADAYAQVHERFAQKYAAAPIVLAKPERNMEAA